MSRRPSTLRLAAFLAGAAFLLAAPAGAALLHAAAHRSGLAAAHAKGRERHAVFSSGVDAAARTPAPSPVAAPGFVAAPAAPARRSGARVSSTRILAPAAPAVAASSRAPPR